MMRKLIKNRQGQGQALVEFAIVLIVLLLILFIIVEFGRILWAWVTVQNAAREGARYAITGQFDPNCLQDNPPCDDPRLSSIETRALERLNGLTLNDEPDRTYEDDFAYFVEVYGVNEFGELQPDFAGVPGQPMAVRVIYNVPILTPILSNIVENVPVMGQVVDTNEPFGQTGSVTTGQSTAPDLPPIPTAGPTPTPTFTPTPSPTPTATDGDPPPPANTLTPTATSTPVRCNLQIENEEAEPGDTFLFLTGDIGTEVTVIDITAGGVELGVFEMTGPVGGHACQGFITAGGMPPFVGSHVLVAQSNDGSFDTIIVEPAPTPTPENPTETPQPTRTPTPTNTATPTNAPTATPQDPFIVIDRSCATGPNIQFTVRGFNWPDANDILLFWEGDLQLTIQSGHGGFFQRTLQFYNLPSDISNVQQYEVEAIAGNDVALDTIDVPCPNITPTPTAVPPTATPVPADLLIVGPPSTNSSPPFTSYQPISFTVTVSNTGEVAVNRQFFVDLFFDVPEEEINDTGIDVAFSTGYVALSQIPAQSTRVITITSQRGFVGDMGTDRTVHSMVDSVLQVNELLETNNVSAQATLQVTPGVSPTPTNTPEAGSGDVGGVVRILSSSWVPQPRAQVYLAYYDSVQDRKDLVQQTDTDLRNGYYTFNGVAEITTAGDYYEVVACLTVDDETRVGRIQVDSLPDPFANVYMVPDPTGCPY